MQKYPRGSRGSPAKGVVWENRSTSSNLVFCAKETTDFRRWFFGVVGRVRTRVLSRVRNHVRVTDNFKIFQKNIDEWKNMCYNNRK